MDSEWDETKRRANILKHGLDFVAAVKIFDGWFIEAVDQRRDYDERRFRAIGELDDRIIHVAYTWRGERRRIISARRAGRNDRRAYYASLAQGARKDEGSH
jgi:uncharacterized DUF497 family protein